MKRRKKNPKQDRQKGRARMCKRGGKEFTFALTTKCFGNSRFLTNPSPLCYRSSRGSSSMLSPSLPWLLAHIHLPPPPPVTLRSASHSTKPYQVPNRRLKRITSTRPTPKASSRPPVVINPQHKNPNNND